VASREGLPGDLVEDELALCREGMVLGKHHISLLVADRLDDQAVVGRGRKQQLGVDVAPLEIPQAARGVEEAYLHFDVGARFQEAAQNGPYQRLDARQQSDDQLAIRAQQRAEDGLCLFGGLQRDSRLLVEGRSGSGETDPAGVPFKELKSNGFLELCDRLRESRLGNMELLGRARYLPLFDDGGEEGQLAEVKLRKNLALEIKRGG
jgi:hypothetical protein